jgi:hypothetical protein
MMSDEYLVEKLQEEIINPYCAVLCGIFWIYRKLSGWDFENFTWNHTADIVSCYDICMHTKNQRD